MKKISLILTSVALLVILVMTVGCGSTKISDIKDDPAQYEGKEVTISGTTSESFWLGILNTGAYQIDDGSGTIWVVTNQTPPDKGDDASAKGTVSTGVKIGDRSLGVVITETSRK